MAYRNKTYVAFDGDKDMWAYRFLKGWDKLKNIDFKLQNAHDLKELTARAQSEVYIKQILKERLLNSKVFILLLGESTKNLRKYVKWEIELAIKLEIPIIVINLNNKNEVDIERCPKSLQNHLTIHGPFKLNFIKDSLGSINKLGYKGLEKIYGLEPLTFKKKYV